MKVKIIKQVDDSVTFEFFNTKGEKLNYEIEDVQKDGIGYMYDIKGIRISQIKKRVINE